MLFFPALPVFLALLFLLGKSYCEDFFVFVNMKHDSVIRRHKDWHICSLFELCYYQLHIYNGNLCHQSGIGGIKPK